MNRCVSMAQSPWPSGTRHVRDEEARPQPAEDVQPDQVGDVRVVEELRVAVRVHVEQSGRGEPRATREEEFREFKARAQANNVKDTF